MTKQVYLLLYVYVSVCVNVCVRVSATGDGPMTRVKVDMELWSASR